MSRREAEAEYANFMQSLPGLVSYIEGVLTSASIDLGGPHDEAISRVGEWLVPLANTRLVKSELPVPFRTEEDVVDLTIPTLGACCYIGLLFGKFILDDVPGTAWTLVTDKKRDVDYHRPVIRPSNDKTQLEPARIVTNFVRQRVDPECEHRPLGVVYRIWKDALSQ